MTFVRKSDQETDVQLPDCAGTKIIKQNLKKKEKEKEKLKIIHTYKITEKHLLLEVLRAGLSLQSDQLYVQLS